MIEQALAAAQQALRGQEIKGKQVELAQPAKWREYADSPEFQAAMDQAAASPAERMAAKAAAMKGDFGRVTKIRTHRNQPKMDSQGNVVYPNGNIWNQLTGWVMYDGKPVPFGQGHTIGPNPTGGPAATPTSTAPPPSASSSDIEERTRTADTEIGQWSSTPATAGIPHGLQPSRFDEPRNYAALAQLDPSTARIVQQMGDYETEPGHAYGRFQNPQLMKLVNAYNPAFKQNQYKIINDADKEYGAQGATGKSMLAMDTAYGHIGSLWKQYAALAGPDTPLSRKGASGSPGQAWLALNRWLRCCQDRGGRRSGEGDAWQRCA